MQQFKERRGDNNKRHDGTIRDFSRLTALKGTFALEIAGCMVLEVVLSKVPQVGIVFGQVGRRWY